jgi:hypothetical protein
MESIDEITNSSNQTFEPEDGLFNLNSLQKQTRPQREIILNQPTINLEETEIGIVDDQDEADFRLVKEFPTVSIQGNNLEINRPLDLISKGNNRPILFAPVYKTEEFHQDDFDDIETVVKPNVHTLETSVIIDDCSIKVGITHNNNNNKFNMAYISETLEVEENLKSDTKDLKNNNSQMQPLRTLYENANENININLNSFAHGSKDIVKIKQNRYALSQQVYELSSQNTEFCREIQDEKEEKQMNAEYFETENLYNQEQLDKSDSIEIQNLPNQNEFTDTEEYSHLEQIPADTAQYVKVNEACHLDDEGQESVENVLKTRVLSQSDLLELESDLHLANDLSDVRISIERSNCIINPDEEMNKIEKIEMTAPFNLPFYSQIIESTTESTNFIQENDDQQFQTNFIESHTLTQSIVHVQRPICQYAKETENFLRNEDDWKNESTDDLDSEVSIKILNQKNVEDTMGLIVDKKLLVWLNYPKTIPLNSEVDDETKLLDEKLDFLYENIRIEQADDDSRKTRENENIINIEKVLSYFISNQEEIEDNVEILKYLPQFRPELQQVILNKQFTHFDLETQNVVKINSSPLKLNNPVELSTHENFEMLQETDESSIKEMEEYTHFDTSSNSLLQFIEGEQQHVYVEKPKCFAIPIQREQNFSINEEFSNDYVEAKVKFDVSPYNDNNLMESTSVRTTLIFNAPYNKRISEIEEIPTELNDESLLDQSANLSIRHIEIPISESIIQQEIYHNEHLIQINENDLNNQETWLSERDAMEPRTSTSLELEPVYNKISYNCDLKSITSYYDEDLEENSDAKTAKNEFTMSFLNAIEQFDPDLNSTDETTLSIDTDDEYLGSFMEQVEKFEVITNDHVFMNSSCANVLHHTIEEARTLVKLNPQNANINREGELLNVLAEQLELPKWEQSENLIVDDRLVTKTDFKSIQPCFDPIEIKIDKAEIENDEMSEKDDTSSASESSGHVHLIESVEVITQHNSNINDNSNQHIHKVDTNRLKIREKSTNEDSHPDSRYKVNFKKEELVDLREITEGLLNTDENNEKGKRYNQKEFAKKFVGQIIHLSSSKLIEIENTNNHTMLKLENVHDVSNSKLFTEEDQEHSHVKTFESKKSEAYESQFENFNFNKLSNKSTSEIIESLSHLKSDISKHLNDASTKCTCCQSQEHRKSKLESEFYDPNLDIMLNETRYSNENYDEEGDGSLRGAREEMFEKFSNRLHSSSNYGNNNENNLSNEYENNNFSSTLLINHTNKMNDEITYENNNFFTSSYSPIKLAENSINAVKNERIANTSQVSFRRYN